MDLLFKSDKRSAIVALDHGALMGPQPGWEEPSITIRAIVKARPDAVILTSGIAKRYGSLLEGKVGMVLSIPPTQNIEHAIEYALKLGAAAVKLFVSVGTNDELSNILRLWDVSTACYKHGIPLIAEMYPVKGEKIQNQFDEGIVAKYARIGMESGADIIKTFYTGNVKSFKEVTRSCPIPILVLGGEKKNDAQLLADIDGAMKAGAAGVAIGRNVWQHKNPTAMTRAIIGMIHDGLGVEDALKLLSK